MRELYFIEFRDSQYIQRLKKKRFDPAYYRPHLLCSHILPVFVSTWTQAGPKFLMILKKLHAKTQSLSMGTARTATVLVCQPIGTLQEGILSLSEITSIASTISGLAATVSLIYVGIQIRQNVHHTRALIQDDERRSCGDMD